MRLPVIPALDTKDGVTNKNARLTNVLKEKKSSEDVAALRPGLVETAVASGNGNGLVRFNDKLISVYGATAYLNGAPDTSIVYYLPLSNNLDEINGAVFVAPSGDANHLPLSGSVTQVTCGGSSAYFAEAYYAPDDVFVEASMLTYDTEVMDIRTSDFTIEFNVYFESVGDEGTNFFLLQASNPSRGTVFTVLLNAVTNYIYAKVNQDQGDHVTLEVLSNLSVTDGAWIHVAVTGYGDVYTLWLNGVVIKTSTVANIDIYGFAGDLGQLSMTITGYGYMSNFLFTSFCKYTAAFTPSCTVLSPAPVSLGTVESGFYDFAQSPI